MSPVRRDSTPAGRVYKINTSKKQTTLVTPIKLTRKHNTYGRGASARKTTLTQIWGWEKIIDDELARAEEERESSRGKTVLSTEDEMLENFKHSNELELNSNDNFKKKGKHSRRKITTNREADQDRPAPELVNPQRTSGRKKTAGDKPSTGVQIQTRHQTIGSSRSLTAVEVGLAHDHNMRSQDEDLDLNNFCSSQKRQSIKLQDNREVQPGFSESPKLSSPIYKMVIPDMTTLPRTPEAESIKCLEVPSSQSPATPLSIIHRASTNFHIPHNEVRRASISPLNFQGKTDSGCEKSTIVGFADTCEPSICSSLEISDSFNLSGYSTIIDSLNPTPSKQSSNQKFSEILQHQKPKQFLSSSLLQEGHEQNSFNAFKPCLKAEILDSEAESDEEPFTQNPTVFNEKYLFNSENLSHKDTQDEILEEVYSVSQDYLELKEIKESELIYADSNITESYYQDTHGPETQSELIKLANIETGLEEVCEIQKNLEKEVPIVTFDCGSFLWANHEENIGLYKDNECVDTQRLSTQYLAQMAPRTAQSDIFMSIDPQRVTEILNGVRDHETRRYQLPPSVCRAWLYERSPISAVNYMAEISPAKHPGDIIDETGIGNHAFNARKNNSSWTAYEILQLYELANPLTLEELKAKEWLKTIPKPMKWVKIPPAVVDELVANIKSPVFLNSRYLRSLSCSIEVDSGGGLKAYNISTDSMASEPLNISICSPSISNNSTKINQQVSKIPSEPRSPSPFSQATTVDLTQIQTSRHQSLEIVCETPTHTDLMGVLPRYPSLQPGRFSSNPDRDIQAPFSLGSSQLLSKSLLEPDSLLNDIVLLPPPILPSSESNIYD